MGAGVIPFAWQGGEWQFLFQRVFSGRKAGYLVDFGGGVGAGESYRSAAAREFVEETETMYLAPDLAAVAVTEAAVREQVARVEALFEATLSGHPDWWSPRVLPDGRSKPWRTFFIRFDYRAVDEMNRAWAADAGRRFRKRRELVWLSAGKLLAIYDREPERLWKRVRQLSRAVSIVREIQAGSP
ncbi:MAG TPA: hypothetical protein ENK50_03405 [Sedimenticola sp.]|nr:hypothetical protein [Sedimenticola sp.]